MNFDKFKTLKKSQNVEEKKFIVNPGLGYKPVMNSFIVDYRTTVDFKSPKYHIGISTNKNGGIISVVAEKGPVFEAGTPARLYHTLYGRNLTYYQVRNIIEREVDFILSEKW